MTDIPVDDIPTEDVIEKFKEQSDHFDQLVITVEPFIRERNHGDLELTHEELWWFVNKMLVNAIDGRMDNKAVYARLSYIYQNGVARRRRGKYKIDQEFRSRFRNLITELMTESESGFSKAQIRKISRMTIPHLREFINRFSFRK